MASPKHPTYPRPTVHEAVCRIAFERDGGWSADVFSRFAAEVRGDFPIFEPAVAVGLQVNVAPGAVGQAILPPRQVLRFRRPDSSVVLQLSEGVLGLNQLPPYPGWESVRAEVLRSWERLATVARPTSVAGIGLRYVNLVPAGPRERPADWLRSGAYLPQAVLDSEPGFFYRAQFRNPSGCAAALTLAAGEAAAEGGDARETGLIFDIDCTVDGFASPDAAALGSRLELLHDLAWAVFSESTAPRLRALMEGRSQ